ncbi:MAG: hypothetical protein ACR2LL_08670 [Nitrosopumilus sp.]
MRCHKCKKVAKQGTSPSWRQNLCPNCFNKEESINQTKILAPDQLRVKTNPVDAYLDAGTLYELQRMEQIPFQENG